MTKYTMTKLGKMGRLKDKDGNTITVQPIQQLRRNPQKRNKPCLCGSNRKFKDCCNPVKKENDNRFAARMFAETHLRDNQNVKSIGISGFGDIYVLLHNDYQESYPETFTCDGNEYQVHVQVSKTSRSEPETDSQD